MSDFYCNIDKVNDLEIEYHNAIETLTDYYYQLNNVVNGAESGKYWQGESFDEFKKAFETWKENYISILNRLILLDGSLSTIYSVSLELIKSRNGLEQSLQISNTMRGV